MNSFFWFPPSANNGGYMYMYNQSWSSQSIKSGVDLSINVAIKISQSDLIDINCIDQSIEIDDTLVLFIDLSWFLPISSIYM